MTSATGLSEAEKRIIAQDWPLIDAKRDQVAIAVFLRIFQADDSAQSLFPRFDGLSRSQLAESPALRAHGLRVVGVLGAAVRDLSDGGGVDGEVLAMIGASHATRGVRGRHFRAMRCALLETLSDILQSSEAARTAAWAKFVDQLLSVIISAQAKAAAAGSLVHA